MKLSSYVESQPRCAVQPVYQALSRDTVFLLGAFLPVCTGLTLLFSGYLSTLLYAATLGTLPREAWAIFGPAVMVSALLGSIILYDKQFGSLVRRVDYFVLLRGHALRFSLLAVVLSILAAVDPAWGNLPGTWFVLWLATSAVLTSLMRVLLATHILRLEQRGVLRETIAIVGSGPIADRLVHQLQQTRARNIELLGVFDDKILGAEAGNVARTGNIAELLELGKVRKIDWIVMTLPCTAEDRLRSIVHRLKALAVPIGLCPQNVGLTLPCHHIDYVGDSVPLTLLMDRPIRRWRAALEAFIPRWVVTLLFLPAMILQAIFIRSTCSTSVDSSQRTGIPTLTYHFDNYDLARFTPVAAGFGQNRYGYVVTPNADHLIRLHDNPTFRDLYAAATYVLLDSRFLSHLLRFTKAIQLPVCTGSDLTAKLLNEVISPTDRLVLIGGNAEQAQQLVKLHGLKRLAHHNPPMGFIHDAEAVEACLNFIETHSPFRFCLLAVGSPQQEILAQQLKIRGVARGLALCIGASINFLTGVERRAPRWMQVSGLEWLFRLLQEPSRMAQRYLVRGPRVFELLRNAEIVLRPVPALSLITSPKPAKVTVQNNEAPQADRVSRRGDAANQSAHANASLPI